MITFARGIGYNLFRLRGAFPQAMRVTLMHNPTAGDEEHSRERLERLIRAAGHEVRYQSMDEEGFASALKDAGDLVAVAGGDGTVRKVALRLIGCETPLPPLTILPHGTANNLAHSLGLDGSPEELILSWTKALRKKFDVGCATGAWGKRRFIEAVGFGLFPATAARIEAQEERNPSEFDSTEQELARDLRKLREMLARYRAEDLQVTLDGQDCSGLYLMMGAMNIPFVGPNLELAPEADPGDGYLEVVFLKEDEREKFAAYLDARLAGKPSFLNLDVRRGRRLTVRCAEAPIHIDDEIWPARTECESEKEKAAEESNPPLVIDVSLEAHSLEFLVNN